MQGDSGSGSVSTVAREGNLALSSQNSSSAPGEYELGLGLSVGVCNGAAGSRVHRLSPRILTAEDLPDGLCSSSSSSTMSRVNGIARTKRTADSTAPSNSSRSLFLIHESHS